MERVDFSDNDFCRYSELSSAMCSEAFLKKKKNGLCSVCFTVVYM